MMVASVNDVIESTTQAKILSESTNYMTSTVWPNSIKSLTIPKQITSNDEQIIFHFGWLDYGFFVGLLGMSTLIGIFYGFFSKHKQNNVSEYILGGRSMKILPVAISMIASLV